MRITRRYEGIILTTIVLVIVLVFSVTYTVISNMRKQYLRDEIYHLVPIEFEAHNGREPDLMESLTPPSNPFLNRCVTDGSFSILFRGIEHYQMIMHHFNRALFLVTIEEMIQFRERLRQIIREGGYFVILFTADNLVSRARATQIEAQISVILQECEPDMIYVMFPSGSVIPSAIRSVFTSNPNVTEIQPTIKFTTAEMNIERIGDIFDFQGIVFVDTTITDLVPLLLALETKLEGQERDPITFNDCIIGCAESETEIQKKERFRQVLQRVSGITRYISVNRATIFEDSFHSLRHVDPNDLIRSVIHIIFRGEDGIDAGGLMKEWYSLLIREIFSPNRALFQPLETNQSAFIPNPRSINSDYFHFVGIFIGKAIIENIPIECHLSRSMYKLMLGRSLTLFDLKEVDTANHQSLTWMAANSIQGIFDDQTFTVGTGDNFGGVSRQEIELIPRGADMLVTDVNKHEYIDLKIQYLLKGSIKTQIDAFLEGFHEMIPQNLISSFTVSELQRLISGVTEIDVLDWESNSQYETSDAGYNADSDQIRWFWQAVRSFTPSEQRKLLLFVTGSPSVPLEGFSMLRSRGEISPFRIVTSSNGPDSLPIAHTCFNRLDLPRYADYDTLREKVSFAINEGNGSFYLN